jgi:hypothetical protein
MVCPWQIVEMAKHTISVPTHFARWFIGMVGQFLFKEKTNALDNHANFALKSSFK